MRKYAVAKVAAMAVLAGVGTATLAGPAFAGADEAQMWSFMDGSSSTTAAAPASTGNVPDGARAEYQGDGFTVLRHDAHQYLDCTGHGGGRLTCKRM